MKDRIINYNLLWEKLRDYAIKVGRLGTRPLLLLYLVLKSPQTSKEDKLLILSTLSYLVLPIDLLDAKKLPIIGWLDEVASATIVYKKVCKYITPSMEAKADAILDRWFPGYTPYELISDEVWAKEF